MNIPFNEHKKLLWYCIGISVVAIINVGLAIYGGIKAYSPVPFWDMWDSYLNFYIQFINGHINVLWQLHNEHRIVLSRLLFILDFVLFNGTGWFLIVINYALVLMVCFVYFRFLKEIVIGTNKHIMYALLFFLVIWLFSWIQQENFTWAFQSQFFLAQLLPLSALYMLYRSYALHNAKWYFVTACILGFLSIGTMANGILALPLMLIMALLLGKNWKYISVIFFLSIASVLLYFHDYQMPPHHGSFIQTVIAHPVEFFQYVMLYIGSPWYRFGGKGEMGKILAYGMAIFFSVSAFYFWVKAIMQEHNKPLRVALLLFILYVLITAAATAGGRLKFGLEKALSSRYTTPTLMAWASLFILYWDGIAESVQKNSKYRSVFGLLLVVIIIPVTIFQFFALHSKADIVFEKKVAALAVEMGIPDQAQIPCVYPDVQHVVDIAKEPVKRNISIFGVEPIKDAGELIGKTKMINHTVLLCQGNIEESVSVNSNYLRVSGWMYCTDQQYTPESIIIVDGSNTIVGYAVTGKPRNDLEKKFGSNARYAGFKGYVLVNYAGKTVHCIGNNPECRMVGTIPQHYNPPFATLFRKTDQNILFANRGDIVFTNLKQKSHVIGSKIEGFSILDSNGVDAPKICIRMKKYGGIYIKSEGDTVLHYKVFTDSKEYFTGIVPVNDDWTILHFTYEYLPENFKVEFFSSNENNKGHFGIAVRE